MLQSSGAPSGGPPLPKEQGLTGSGQEGSNGRRQVKKEECACNRPQEHGLGSPIDLGSKLASDLGQLTTAAAAAKLLQSWPTLSDPMDCSLPGSSVHGIFQARVLEWGAIAFSNKHFSLPYIKSSAVCIEFLLFSPDLLCCPTYQILQQSTLILLKSSMEVNVLQLVLFLFRINNKLRMSSYFYSIK